MVAGCAVLFLFSVGAGGGEAPIRVALVGLVHGHAKGFLRALPGNDSATLVAVVEPREDLAKEYAAKFGLDSKLFYTDLERMLAEQHPVVGQHPLHRFAMRRKKPDSAIEVLLHLLLGGAHDHVGDEAGAFQVFVSCSLGEAATTFPLSCWTVGTFSTSRYAGRRISAARMARRYRALRGSSRRVWLLRSE